VHHLSKGLNSEVGGPPRPLVRLVTSQGTDASMRNVDEAHRMPGMLHRAFSVVLHDENGNVLLQRRSLAKTRWPGYVANSCCGHPLSRGSLLEDARTRVSEELGIDVLDLREAGQIEYRAQMPQSQWVEWEYDHVLVGAYHSAAMHPDPDEVSDTYWVPGRDWAIFKPITPWLGPVMQVALPAIS
jgi:isopentenyl-diphosphate delta-isomerase